VQARFIRRVQVCVSRLVRFGPVPPTGLTSCSLEVIADATIFCMWDKSRGLNQRAWVACGVLALFAKLALALTTLGTNDVVTWHTRPQPPMALPC